MSGGRDIARSVPNARRLAPVLATAGVLLASAARGQEKELAGAEFIDMPAEALEAKRAELASAPPPPDEKEAAGYVPGYQRRPSVGLSAHAPGAYSGLPGTLMPAFGAPVPSRDWRFSFTGYIQAVMRASIGERENAIEGQKNTTLHGDPVLPGGSYGWFDHSMTVPTPWAQINFSYGNETVRATTHIGAWSVRRSDEASGYSMPQAQQWFTDAFLTYTPDVSPVGLKVDVGVYQDRYGAMAQYHNGAYGTPLIAGIYGVGTTGTLSLPFEGDVTAILEGGFKGDFNKPPLGIIQENSNEYARPEEGSTYAAHAHFGVTLKEIVTPSLHYIVTWSQDDRTDPEDDPSTALNESHLTRDGRLRILGADVRANGGRFGYFYAGGVHIDGKEARSVSNLVYVLNSGSGKELMERYWGFSSRGNGSLTFVGGQYTLSLGALLRYPMEYWGEGPDLNVSLFGIYGHSESVLDEFARADMFKYGTEIVYSVARYFAPSVRVDHVVPDLGDASRSFLVISPKLTFRSDWVTRESLTVQYAGYVLGDNVEVKGDNRLVNIASRNPDRHLVAVYGTMWW